MNLEKTKQIFKDRELEPRSPEELALLNQAREENAKQAELQRAARLETLQAQGGVLPEPAREAAHIAVEQTVSEAVIPVTVNPHGPEQPHATA
jgi:hypothetical protein